MKNENIHNVFPEKEIRDFLAKELSEAEEESAFISVEHAQKRIEELQHVLKYARKVRAIKYLINENGWKDWDISEDILYDKKTYFPFIGTKEEYNKLMSQLTIQEY